MSIESEALKIMVQEIKKMIKVMIDQSTFDRTTKGRIIRHIDGKYYEVQINNQRYKALSPNFVYQENDVVYVKIAENNYNNLIIECLVK